MLKKVFLYLFICSFIVPPAYSRDNIETIGDILQIALPVTAFGMTFHFKDNKGRGKFYKSALIASIVTVTLKYTVYDVRPNGNDSHSFVSGHTVAAFLGASFMQRRYGWKYGAIYIPASFVGWSRIKSKNHDFYDVGRGAILGIISTYIFTRHRNKDSHLMPLIKPNTYGLNFTYEW